MVDKGRIAMREVAMEPLGRCWAHMLEEWLVNLEPSCGRQANCIWSLGNVAHLTLVAWLKDDKTTGVADHLLTVSFCSA